MLKRSTSFALAAATILSACEKPIVLSNENPVCTDKAAYSEGLKLVEAELRYPAGSKFPPYEESAIVDMSKTRGECHFSWMLKADIQNKYGALRRSLVVITFHYDVTLDRWVKDKFIL